MSAAEIVVRLVVGFGALATLPFLLRAYVRVERQQWRRYEALRGQVKETQP